MIMDFVNDHGLGMSRTNVKGKEGKPGIDGRYRGPMRKKKDHRMSQEKNCFRPARAKHSFTHRFEA
jgi:hypothetical protein